MKLFIATDMQVVTMCREHFDFVLPSVQLDHSATEKLCRLSSYY